MDDDDDGDDDDNDDDDDVDSLPPVQHLWSCNGAEPSRLKITEVSIFVFVFNDRDIDFLNKIGDHHLCVRLGMSLSTDCAVWLLKGGVKPMFKKSTDFVMAFWHKNVIEFT